jgi:hypothetical protein
MPINISMADQMFRTQALEKLSSPEQLDQLLKVTSPRSWLLLAAFSIIVTGIVIWGFVGQIPFNVDAYGILAKEGGVNPIVATENGILIRYTVKPGDIIKIGDPVAEIDTLTPQGQKVRKVLTSTIYGRIIETWKSDGHTVSAGDVIANSEYHDQPLKAIVFTDIASAKKIIPGMKVMLRPVNVEADKYGVLLGKVIYVGRYPSSPAAISGLIVGETLTGILASHPGLSVRVDVELEPDPTTNSGFAWTSKVGPPFKLYSGTLVRAAIQVERQRPVDMVLPLNIEGRGAESEYGPTE